MADAYEVNVASTFHGPLQYHEARILCGDSPTSYHGIDVARCPGKQTPDNPYVIENGEFVLRRPGGARRQ